MVITITSGSRAPPAYRPRVTAPVPAATRLAWWGTSWLRGHVVADHVIDAVIDTDATHVVAGLATLGLGGEKDAAEGLMTGLGRLRAEGAISVGAAYPAEGDPIGLGGPTDFNAAALESGEAVVVLGAAVGLVPTRVGAAVTWQAFRAERRPLPDVGEADQALREALLHVSGDLARLDVAHWRPEVADRLSNLRRRPRLTSPPGVPERCVDLASRALQALDIVELALDDDGAALTSYEADARRQALVPLARAGRRALVAASSPEVWPPD
jgi:hypothetical protein